MWKKLLYVERWKFLPPKLNFNAKLDFSAEIQSFSGYFYPLHLNFNADLQKFSAEIPFTQYSL